eukprot:9386362-Lingulodinium_polyedra.AAC.1
MAMLPKGALPQDGIAVARVPSMMRPINLSNTGPKLCATGICYALAPIIHCCISIEQVGGIKGRSMIDAVLAIEASGLALFGAAVCAAIVAFDFSAAFPSVSRRYLWAVLAKYG